MTRKKKFLIAALVAITAAFVALAFREDEGKTFESIAIGEKVERVYELLGPPSETNKIGEFTDLRYWITYTHRRGYSLLGVSMGYPRIIRIKNGMVASKGMNEAYYDPYKPGWVPIEQSANQSAQTTPVSAPR
jgi:hypothetical protein